MISLADFEPLSFAKIDIFSSATGVLQKDISVTCSPCNSDWRGPDTNYAAWRRQFPYTHKFNRTKNLHRPSNFGLTPGFAISVNKDFSAIDIALKSLNSKDNR